MIKHKNEKKIIFSDVASGIIQTIHSDEKMSLYKSCQSSHENILDITKVE